MRKKNEALRESLLNHAREIAGTDGIGAINIRSLARQAGVAAGTVYNYFTSKEEILLALTEEYWQVTLQEMENVITSESFCGQLEEIYAFLKEQITLSAGKLMNSLGSAEPAGQERMASMQSVFEAALIRRMEQDPLIRRDIWNETFTREQFARFIMLNMMMLLKTKTEDPQFFITLVKRILC